MKFAMCPRWVPKPVLALCLTLLVSTSGWAQSYPLVITDRAIENPYVLHPRDWPNQLGNLCAGSRFSEGLRGWLED